MLDPEKLFPRSEVRRDAAGDFIGRIDLLMRGLDALSSAGGSAVIIGARGIGKTSLAWQIVTTLEDNNPRFNRHDYATIGLDRQFTFCFVTCPVSVQSVEDLLLSILLPSSDEFSLSHRFPKTYSNRTISELKRKYEFNLATLAKINYEFQDSKENKQKAVTDILGLADKPYVVRSAFNDIVHQICKEYGKEIVFVVDEADRLAQISGVGHFLKDSDVAHFLFVGVADNVSSILGDHLSAGRKLADADLVVPPFTDEETLDLYELAIAKSNGSLEVEPGFLSDVVKFSYGFPWIAKQVGFTALQSLVRGALARRSKLEKYVQPKFVRTCNAIDCPDISEF